MEQQNQQSIQEKAENKPPAKTNWKFIVIVALIAVVVSVAGILLLRNDVRNQVFHTPVPMPSPQTPVVDDTSMWQTYRNEEFGFEFRYPEQHYVINEGGDYWDVYMYVPGEPKTPDKPIDPPSLIMEDHEGEISLESYISRVDNANARDTSTQVLEEKKGSVGGYPALQRVQRNLRARPSSLEIETFIDISPTVIWRVLIFGGQENDLRNFNGQILSTFRFTE